LLDLFRIFSISCQPILLHQFLSLNLFIGEEEEKEEEEEEK